jgi:hypothetical protein
MYDGLALRDCNIARGRLWQAARLDTLGMRTRNFKQVQKPGTTPRPKYPVYGSNLHLQNLGGQREFLIDRRQNCDMRTFA